VGDLDRATERFGQKCGAAACQYAAELLERNLLPQGDGKDGWSTGVKASMEELYRVALNHDERVRELE
jgi:hypothetical protein